LDALGVWQFVTFRLADSLPAGVMGGWRRELEDDPEMDREVVRRVERYLDEGHGSCVLGDAEHGAVMEGALRHFDGERYFLAAWVVMPNHVHVLVQMRDAWSLGETVASWKRFSATRINRAANRRGRLWQVEYFDRFIRDREHFERVVAYIHQNPVKAGLCASPERWPFSSARFGPQPTASLG